MSVSVQQAAVQLLHRIQAPKGAVNTRVHWDNHGPLIMVMVDPLYWNAIAGIPQTFADYRVILEKREPTVAFQ